MSDEIANLFTVLLMSATLMLGEGLLSRFKKKKTAASLKVLPGHQAMRSVLILLCGEEPWPH